MIVPEPGKNVEYSEKELKRYTFHANLNPIFNCEEAELTTIQIAAPNEEHAWVRLSWLLGSPSKAEKFRLDDVEAY